MSSQAYNTPGYNTTAGTGAPGAAGVAPGGHLPTTGERIAGTVERTMGHMLPGTDLGHQLKADGARKKGNEVKAEKAESHMDHGVHSSVTTGSYLEGEAERALGHSMPGTQTGHRLKAEGALHKGDVQKAERAESHLKGPRVL
ncbi:uncharacterized protein SPPG_00348 [Spizellomyces punctatus DAOM BR117]|uniref:Uncharacterized protein n=1 Tax=Spizellomyces punctatus (strain DAOM BR117) TaxID=645134 RepID=A0A0L0HTH0_SPIPD|nr:uncharacterized protein SPPG_00348 [Spizellomyces punctatus DAOM BR117]KND04631.1 hypothetical protein SPPG_00348 [Spizellomyces punctatus DAOM BR117]|eukprot:XP_016612670.1 hypothetical protein SPPG_00348 [Spizellomyces punctatus DAOM BR117]